MNRRAWLRFAALPGQDQSMPTFGPGVQVIGSGCGYVLLDTNTLEIRGVPSRQCQAKRMDQGAIGWGVRAKCRESKSREAARGNE